MARRRVGKPLDQATDSPSGGACPGEVEACATEVRRLRLRVGRPLASRSLVSRCEAAGLVSRSDRRRVEVRLTRRGGECLERLARLHRDELMSLQTEFAMSELMAFLGTGQA